MCATSAPHQDVLAKDIASLAVDTVIGNVADSAEAISVYIANYENPLASRYTEARMQASVRVANDKIKCARENENPEFPMRVSMAVAMWTSKGVYAAWAGSDARVYVLRGGHCQLVGDTADGMEVVGDIPGEHLQIGQAYIAVEESNWIVATGRREQAFLEFCAERKNKLDEILIESAGAHGRFIGPSPIIRIRAGTNS